MRLRAEIHNDEGWQVVSLFEGTESEAETWFAGLVKQYREAEPELRIVHNDSDRIFSISAQCDSVEDFIAERREVLMSLDEEKIKAYYRKYNFEEPPEMRPGLFMVSVHKAITAAKDIPIEFRRASKIWLEERDFKSLDDGDL